jgi:hypothetical protein
MQRSRDSEQTNKSTYTHTKLIQARRSAEDEYPLPPPRYFLHYSIAECTFPPVARRARTFCEALVKPMSCNCYESEHMTIQERDVYEMPHLELDLEPLLRRACVHRSLTRYTAKKLKQCTWIPTKHIRHRWWSAGPPSGGVVVEVVFEAEVAFGLPGAMGSDPPKGLASGSRPAPRIIDAICIIPRRVSDLRVRPA